VRAGDLVDLARGALLHDIGKIGVPDAILRKPGRLTEAERRQMQRHPEIGYRVIADIPSFAQAAEIVLHHHEFYDGRGYPNGLAGDDIPLGARIFAVADALDAMTCDRPYRRAMSRAQALAEIARCRGSQFDPRVVDALLSMSEGEVFGPSLVAPATIPLDAVTAPLEPALRA
jgi:HD-GYP domain-containing protein (c-di-GMP phosphodiesterase class II)